MGLIQQTARIFAQAWRRYGQPVATIVKPLAQWALPTGFAYDATVDAVTNAAGTVLPNPEAYWATATVYIVPSGGTAEERVLSAAGILPADTLYVSILPADEATVRAAHSIAVDGAWYDVGRIMATPAGVTAWLRVELRRRS